MTSTRLGTSTWIAARPMPGAAYIVASMSSIRRRRPSSTAATVAEMRRSDGSGASMIGMMVITEM